MGPFFPLSDQFSSEGALSSVISFSPLSPRCSFGGGSDLFFRIVSFRLPPLFIPKSPAKKGLRRRPLRARFRTTTFSSLSRIRRSSSCRQTWTLFNESLLSVSRNLVLLDSFGGNPARSDLPLKDTFSLEAPCSSHDFSRNLAHDSTSPNTTTSYLFP